MLKPIRIFVGITLLLLSMGSSLAATWRDDVPNAKLIGSGDLRWMMLHIYSAELYMEEPVFDPQKKFALVLTYHKSISRDRFVETSLDEIKRLKGQTVDGETLKKWKGYMDSAFTDVKSGDQLIGVHLPNIGCRFYSKDKLLTEISDPAFADAFFSIWFDPRSRDKDLRKKLTGASK
jgi:hypothetical protein